MQTIHGRTLLTNVELSVQKIGRGSLHIQYAHLIAHHRISSSLDMLRTTCREFLFQSQEEWLAGMREALDEMPVETLKHISAHWTEGFDC
jgi:hypothetical protein